MIIGTILKNAIKILATNPTARKKAGEVAFTAYKKAKPFVRATSKTIKKTLEKNLKK
jgi:hypothetical protein